MPVATTSYWNDEDQSAIKARMMMEASTQQQLPEWPEPAPLTKTGAPPLAREVRISLDRSRQIEELRERCLSFFRPAPRQETDDSPNATIEDNTEVDQDDDGDSDNLILLITGSPGVGKTTLAWTLREMVTRDLGGHMVGVQLDAARTPTETKKGETGCLIHGASPYYPFIKAFSSLERDIVVSDAQEASAEHHRLRAPDLKESRDGRTRGVSTSSSTSEALDLVETTFRAAILHGPEDPPPLHATMPECSDARFRHVFCQIVARLCRKDQPLVLLLDDLHLATKESLDVIVALLTDASIEGLMMVATCCQVSMDHPLSTMLRALEDEAAIRVSELRLDDLSLPEVAKLVDKTLGIESSTDGTLLTTFLYQQTLGNPFWLTQLLQTLIESRVIYEDSQTKTMTCDLDRINRIEAQRYQDAVVFLGHRIRHLPPALQDLLKTAACLGFEFESCVVNLVNYNRTSTEDDLFAEAESRGLLRRVQGKDNFYCFTHQKVHEACYDLVTAMERPAMHLKIGRRLWRAFRDCPSLEDRAILIVLHLRIGKDLLLDDCERVTLAELCLLAGRQEGRLSLFQSAAATFELGISLLPAKSWRDQYELTLALFSAGAEVEYSIGNYDKVDVLVEDVLKHARTLEDKLSAFSTKIHALGSRQRLKEAIGEGLMVLDELEEPLPRQTGRIQCRLALRRTSQLLRSLSDDCILALPNIEDRRKIAAMQLMNIMYPYVFGVQPGLAFLMGARMVEISLKHGLCAVSALGFSIYGSIICDITDQFAESFRCGDLALRIIDKFEAREWIPRVYVGVFCSIKTNKSPLREVIPYLLQAGKTGLETGDTEFAMKALLVCAVTQFLNSVPLPSLQKSTEQYRQLMIKFQQKYVLTHLSPLMQVIANLRGESKDPLVLKGQYFNEVESSTQEGSDKTSFAFYKIMGFKAMLAYILNDYKTADVILCEICFHLCRVGVMQYRLMVVWLRALSSLKMAREENVFHRAARLQKVHRLLRILKDHAKHAPENLLHRVHFLEAEIAVTTGRPVEESLVLYKLASQQASSQGSVYEQAMILENAGLALCQAGSVYQGVQLLHRARARYSLWGATVKVRQMDPLVPPLADSEMTWEGWD